MYQSSFSISVTNKTPSEPKKHRKSTEPDCLNLKYTKELLNEASRDYWSWSTKKPYKFIKSVTHSLAEI